MNDRWLIGRQSTGLASSHVFKDMQRSALSADPSRVPAVKWEGQ